jgi:hypothetical protein
MLPVPHLSPTSFCSIYSSLNEARLIYNLPWLSYHKYIFLLMHKCQQSLNELFNDALRTSEVILAFVDIGCQVCKVLFRTISGTGQPRKCPRQSSRWDLFPEPDCVTSVRWAQLRMTFSLRKEEWAEKAWNARKTFDCYHLNQARTQTLSVLPGPGPGPYRPLHSGTPSRVSWNVGCPVTLEVHL